MGPTLQSALSRLAEVLTHRLEAEPAVARPDSVEITRDSKGTKVAVKVYAPTVEEAGERAQAEYDRLAKQYGEGS